MEPGWRCSPQGALFPGEGESWEEGRGVVGLSSPEHADKDMAENVHTSPHLCCLPFTGLPEGGIMSYKLIPQPWPGSRMAQRSEAAVHSEGARVL